MPSKNVSFQHLGWSIPILPGEFWLLRQLNATSPGLTPVSSSSGMALGRGSSDAQGGMLPRVRQGAVYAPARQGARKSEQVSKLFRAQLKHIFTGRDICMENSREKFPLQSLVWRGECEMIGLRHLNLTPQNPPGSGLSLRLHIFPSDFQPTSWAWKRWPNLGADIFGTDNAQTDTKSEILSYHARHTVNQQQGAGPTTLSKKICRTTSKRCCFPGKTTIHLRNVTGELKESAPYLRG